MARPPGKIVTSEKTKSLRRQYAFKKTRAVSDRADGPAGGGKSAGPFLFLDVMSRIACTTGSSHLERGEDKVVPL